MNFGQSLNLRLVIITCLTVGHCILMRCADLTRVGTTSMCYFIHLFVGVLTYNAAQSNPIVRVKFVPCSVSHASVHSARPVLHSHASVHSARPVLHSRASVHSARPVLHSRASVHSARPVLHSRDHTTLSMQCAWGPDQPTLVQVKPGVSDLWV